MLEQFGLIKHRDFTFTFEKLLIICSL